MEHISESDGQLSKSRCSGKSLSELKQLRLDALILIERIYNSANDDSQASAHLHVFYPILCKLYDLLELFDSPIEELILCAPKYDFKTYPANGYRSLLKVTSKCFACIQSIIQSISSKNQSYLFRSSHYCMELESYVLALAQLKDVLRYALKLRTYCGEGELCPPEYLLNTPFADEIQMEMDLIDQECFYGRTLGFQYCASMKRPFEVVHIGLATYSHNFQQVGSPYIKLAGSLLTSRKYVLNPEARAEKVVSVTQNCDIKFCKAFWSLSESDLLHKLANLALPVCKVNHVFSITPQDIHFPRTSGDTVLIPAPSAHFGHRPLQLRLMSSHFRVGQDRLDGFPAVDVFPKCSSKYLIIQCHGGGFVSQTSRTHEAYLRYWARDLDVPIFCIDYSLAPEAPYPRALEEVYYAYVWALKNCHLLGTTAEHVAMVGDSAGGNLLFATMLRAIADGIRLPDGLVACYTPVYIQFLPSPSRVLSVMDALLPVGILTKCLEAYAGDQIEPWKGRGPNAKCSPMEPLSNTLPSRSCASNGQGFSLQGQPTSPDEEEFFHAQDIASPLPKDVNLSYETRRRRACAEAATPKALASALSDSCTEAADHEIQELFAADIRVSPGQDLTGSLGLDPYSVQHQADIIGHKLNRRPQCLPIAVSEYSARHYAQSPLRKFQNIQIKQCPFLSPITADDQVLCRMPSTYLVACHLDPCLDDSIMFAKRLDALGVKVHLDTVEDVPHGFMNFALVSSECMQAVHLCAARLRDALGLVEPTN